MAPAPRQSPRFLLLFALAWAGVAVAYVPFLTILLPLRVSALAGDAAVRSLGLVTFFGAAAASVGNIAFGWLSDLSGRRRPWVAAGLALATLLLLAMPRATSLPALIALVMLWQLALNMTIAPLAAWAADHVPPGQTGLFGGLMALSPAIGAMSAALVTQPGLAGPDARLAIVAAVVGALIVPVLLLGRPVALPAPPSAPARPRARRPLYAMWAARLLVQVAEAALFAYLLYFFRSLDGTIPEHRVARLFGAVLAAAVPVALIAGRWADRRRRPGTPLTISAALAALGLVALSLAGTTTAASAAYVLFGLATTVFLALHSGQTLRVLPDPARRGRDLGLFNLTNTVPSLVMPWLTIALVPAFGFDALFLLLAALAALAALLLALAPPADEPLDFAG